MPPPIAPFASWTWRMSSCVSTISPPPAAAPWGIRISRRSSPRSASLAPSASGKRSRRSIWMSPVQSMRPTSSAAATASMRPEPQIPWGALSPITWNRRSPFSTHTRSMAPTAPRMPWRICAPSSAGPAGAEHAIRRSRVPMTTSPLVPMSTTARTCDALVEACGEGGADRIGADEAGDDRQEAHARLGIDLEAKGPRRQHEGVPDDGGVGGQTHVRRVDAEKHVVHACVADDGGLVDPLRKHAGPREELVDLLVQEADDPALELPQVRRIPLGEGDPRHQVAAERRLRIQARHRGHQLAGCELEQRGDHAGRADVDREAERHGARVAALDAEGRALERDDGDLALRLPQGRGQRPDDVQRHVGRRDARRGRELLEV